MQSFTFSYDWSSSLLWSSKSTSRSRPFCASGGGAVAHASSVARGAVAHASAVARRTGSALV
eukprot:2777372-Heterocapsa_arctica.AAC.2